MQVLFDRRSVVDRKVHIVERVASPDTGLESMPDSQAEVNEPHDPSVNGVLSNKGVIDSLIDAK